MFILPMPCRDTHAGHQSQNSRGPVYSSSQDSEAPGSKIHGVLVITKETEKKQQTLENLHALWECQFSWLASGLPVSRAASGPEGRARNPEDLGLIKLEVATKLISHECPLESISEYKVDRDSLALQLCCRSPKHHYYCIHTERDPEALTNLPPLVSECVFALKL